MVREVLYRIRNTTDKGILVLCNYRGQLDDIKSTLAQDRFHNVTFRTVDSSQVSFSMLLELYKIEDHILFWVSFQLI